jgi:ABC-type uncharacterized transport system permease subunit
MGALFYRPIFALVGFWPFPYRVFCFVFLIANLGLLWLAIRSITQSREIASLSTLIGAFHPQLVEISIGTTAPSMTSSASLFTSEHCSTTCGHAMQAPS